MFSMGMISKLIIEVLIYKFSRVHDFRGGGTIKKRGKSFFNFKKMGGHCRMRWKNDQKFGIWPEKLGKFRQIRIGLKMSGKSKIAFIKQKGGCNKRNWW